MQRNEWTRAHRSPHTEATEGADPTSSPRDPRQRHPNEASARGSPRGPWTTSRRVARSLPQLRRSLRGPSPGSASQPCDMADLMSAVGGFAMLCRCGIEKCVTHVTSDMGDRVVLMTPLYGPLQRAVEVGLLDGYVAGAGGEVVRPVVCVNGLPGRGT